MKLGELAINSEVSKEDYLEISNGEVVKSIKELTYLLDKISDEDFNYHVSKSHNEFRDWISDAYGDHNLADKVGKTSRRKKMIRILNIALKKGRMNNAHQINIPRKKKDILDQIKKSGRIL